MVTVEYNVIFGKCEWYGSVKGKRFASQLALHLLEVLARVSVVDDTKFELLRLTPRELEVHSANVLHHIRCIDCLVCAFGPDATSLHRTTVRTKVSVKVTLLQKNRPQLSTEQICLGVR